MRNIGYNCHNDEYDDIANESNEIDQIHDEEDYNEPNNSTINSNICDKYFIHSTFTIKLKKNINTCSTFKIVNITYYDIFVSYMIILIHLTEINLKR